MQQITSDALKGAIAGAVGVWVMDRLDWYMFNHEDPAARQQTQEVRPQGMDPAHVVTHRAADAAGMELSDKQLHSAGQAVHYGIGMAPAAVYGAFRHKLPVSSPGQDALYGLAYGAGLFLVQDEGINAATGISAKPQEYPWQAHARGLAAHLVLGLVTNTVLNLLDASRPGDAQQMH
jgi:hypothetical protein